MIMTMSINKIEIIGVSIVGVLLVMLGMNTGLFWDNVLFVSKMGTPLYENGIFNWLSIPIDSDPGHPPFIAILMAMGWKIFGRSLETSHWIMLPFIIGLLWQLLLLVKHFVKESHLKVWALLLILSDPTLLCQLILINPEPILLFFFFLSLNAILNEKYFYKVIGISLLGIVSLRGMMLCAGLFLFDLFYTIYIIRDYKKFISKKNILIYFLASLLAILYLVWRLNERGYISSHPNETYGNAWAFESVQMFFKNFARNIVVLIHRFLDFGRVIPILFVVLAFFLKKELRKQLKVKTLLFGVFVPTSVIYTISIIIINPMSHIYYIASFVCIILLAFVMLQQMKHSKAIFVGILISLLAGNLIVYPQKIAQGWDASLAHLPYWNLRKEAITYLDNNRIDIRETASFFPNYTSIDDVDLNGDTRSFKRFSGNAKYVFYSNVYNVTDEDLNRLSTDYHIIKAFRKNRVYINIYLNNHLKKD